MVNEMLFSSTARTARSRSEELPELAIDVVSALGTGRTPLSAFDDALLGCGVHNFNLISLSSVIPPCSTVTVKNQPAIRATDHDHGKRLYVVRAEQRSSRPGSTVGAGVGWFQWDDGRGLFVEHERESAELTVSDMEAAIERQIRTSLEDLAVRRGILWSSVTAHTHVVAGNVGDRPLCALVLAVFEAESWRGIGSQSEQSEVEDPS
jgi:arginine decarboxylase